MNLNARVHANYASVNVNCEKLTLTQLHFRFFSKHQGPINAPTNCGQIYQAILEKKLISLALLFSVTMAILDSQPG